MPITAMTGATGFIGGRLLDRLLARTDSGRVRVLVRSLERAKDFEALGAEVVVGDLADTAALRQLCAGADILYHLAATRSYWTGDRKRQLETNVGGTKRALTAAHVTGVKRVVFTSSVAAIGVPEPARQPADETFPFNCMWCPYHESKWLSEQEAFSWTARGLEVVAVNPAVVFGAGNVRLDQGTMRAVWDVVNGRPFFPSGGMSVCDVDDVVDGHIAAATRGRSGARYILAGDNLTHQEALSMLAGAFGKKAPRIRVPGWALTAVLAPIEAVSRVTGRAPMLTLAHARLSSAFNWFSSKRAEDELGYQPRPFAETADAMARDLRAKGVLK